MNRYYVSLQKLGIFLDNCKNIFANINHTHIISSITDISSETWTFTLEDGSTVTKEVVVK